MYRSRRTSPEPGSYMQKQSAGARRQSRGFLVYVAEACCCTIYKGLTCYGTVLFLLVSGLLATLFHLAFVSSVGRSVGPPGRRSSDRAPVNVTPLKRGLATRWSYKVGLLADGRKVDLLYRRFRMRPSSEDTHRDGRETGRGGVTRATDCDGRRRCHARQN